MPKISKQTPADENDDLPVSFPIPFKSTRIKYGRYFTPEEYIAKGKECMLFTSSRNTGKSVSILCWQLEHFLETGEKFIYCRSLNDILNNTRDSLMIQPNKLIFQDSYNLFFYVGRKGIIYLHTEDYGEVPAGLCISISQAEKNKSVDFSEYTSLFYDECVSETAIYSWAVPNLLSLLTSIIRERKGFKIFLAANNIRCPEEFLRMMKFDPADPQYKREGLWTNEKCLFANFISKEITESIKAGTLGFLLKETSYGKMALDNDNGIQDRFRIGTITNYNQMWTSCQGVLWFKDSFGDSNVFGLLKGHFKCKRKEKYVKQNYHSGQIFRLSSEDTLEFLKQSEKKTFTASGMRDKINLSITPLDYKSNFKPALEQFMDWWEGHKNEVMYDSMETYNAITSRLKP